MQTIQSLQEELSRIRKELAALRRSHSAHSSDYRDYVPVHGGRVHKDVAARYGLSIRPEVLRYKVSYEAPSEDSFVHVTMQQAITYAELCMHIEELKKARCRNFIIVIT